MPGRRKAACRAAGPGARGRHAVVLEGIQGRAAAFIERLGGSYSGIIGLPLCETATLLNRLRFLRPEACAGGGGSA
jgi:hypothetical protein